MSRKVAEAILEERVLLCEAGTGTGKTLAYLVPAILAGRRVVISTATKALQEQIYAKDLPLLADHLGVPFRASLMKGLANYLCRRRLSEAFTAESSRERASLLARIEQWARESTSGDRVELEWLRDDDPLWRDVQSGSDTRIGQNCPFYERCFVTKMRDEAQRANLVVVNHHLYLADLALRRGGARQGVIPEHDVVIFDEAHQLEEIATDFFGVRVSSARVESVVRDGRRSVLSSQGRFANEAHDAGVLLDEVANASQAMFSQLAMEHGARATDGRIPFPEEAWSAEALGRRDRLDEALAQLAKWCSAKEQREELALIARRATSTRDDLARVSSPNRGEVAWIEVKQRSCAIGVSPIDLAPVFRNELFAVERPWPRTAILTSATLATGEGFLHTKRRLGLSYEKWVDAEDDEGGPRREVRDTQKTLELVVPSPFDFRKNAGVYVPVDLPEPNDPSFLERAATRTIELLKASRGGAFVLCASTRNMRALHAAIRDAELPWPLLVQGERPKFSLLAEFREHGNAVLVATMGFWEGVDVPGRALRLVVIDKLPFAVPTDPVVAARHRAIEEEGRSSFAELSVPEAAIALKQGFGRLIRTHDDAGVVAILDKRLRTKGYGRTMRATLPPASPLYDLGQVRAFFEVVVAPDRGERSERGDC
ncbi:MAG: ATP-dependent DNA helicase [Sandaracinaceae bacterium]|nr:ATP-dependent DNA helicase [Sandaracinaceae bacterium]